MLDLIFGGGAKNVHQGRWANGEWFYFNSLVVYNYILVAEFFPPGVRKKSEGVKACLHGSG